MNAHKNALQNMSDLLRHHVDSYDAHMYYFRNMRISFETNTKEYIIINKVKSKLRVRTWSMKDYNLLHKYLRVLNSIKRDTYGHKFRYYLAVWNLRLPLLVQKPVE